MLELLLVACAFPSPSDPPPELGGFVAEVRELEQPAAAVFAADGRAFVVEAFAHRVAILDRDGKRAGELGGFGTAPGQLCDPRGIALAPATGDAPPQLFVADTANHRICVFGLDGAFVRTLGRRGHGAGELHTPRGLAVDAQHVYVADTRNHRIAVFARDGAFVRNLGSFGGASGKADGDALLLRFPADVALDVDGRLYIADQDNHRIVVSDANGKVLARWGSFGPHPGQLASPSGVEVRGERVYVADRDNHRIAVFDRAGTRLDDWGVHALRPHEGGGKLHYPDQIALDEKGERALVVEGFEDRCQLFGPASASDVDAMRNQERNTAAHFGGALDAARDLIVATEPGAPGIVVLDTSTPTPIEITRYGGLGPRLAEFVRPEAIELDASATFAFVGDCGARRLSVFRVDRPANQELRYDPALARLSVSIDFTKLHALGADGSRDASRAPIEPLALECGPNGALFVLDAANDEVVELASDLSVRRRIGRYGSGPGEWLEPVDLALDRAGKRLYVADAGAARVAVLELGDGDPRALASLGMRGESPDAFVRPAGVACAADGSLLVADEGAHRVLRFGLDGKFAAAFGKRGIAAGELFKPRGLALDRDEHLVIVDHGNHRGLVVTLAGELVGSFGSRLFTQALRPAPPAAR